jgi:long-chain fatty acid transport protein
MLNDKWTLRAGYNHTENPVTPPNVTFNIIAPGVVQNQYSAGTTYRIDRDSEVTGSFMFAANNSVTGPSFFGPFITPPGATPTATETISMKQYLLGLAYSRKF